MWFVCVCVCVCVCVFILGKSMYIFAQSLILSSIFSLAEIGTGEDRWINKPITNHILWSTTQGFFSEFLMGGTQNFWSDEVGWGDLQKNLTEAKTAHLMQN